MSARSRRLLVRGTRPLAIALSLAALAPSVARAFEPPRRYGDPVAAPSRGALETRVEALCRRLAADAKAPPLEVDPRLEAALDALAAELHDGGPPPVELTERALWLAGIVEPVPYLVVMTVPDGADEDVLRQAEKIVPGMLARGRYRRVAVASAPIKPGERRLVIALQESFLALAPVARALPESGSLALDGRILAPYASPSLFVTDPGGRVERLAARPGPASSFHGAFRCGEQNGTYEIEVAAEDRFGETVLANFPVYCGVPAPAHLDGPREPKRASASSEAPAATPAEARAAAEARVLALLQADRARAGLPPLRLDPRLTAIARSHSDDMRDHGFFGHLSPTTGSAMNRVDRAGLAVLRVRENLGRAWSPEELERGLMNSPSHRANLLATDVDCVGIGVAVDVSPSGAPDLYLTQLFAALPPPFEPARAKHDLAARLDEIRRGHALRVFGNDPTLDALAERVAHGIADGSLADSGTGARDPVEQALAGLSSRYRWVRKVSARVVGVSQIDAAPALLDREATHAGLAVVKAAHTKPGESPLVLVILLASKR